MPWLKTFLRNLFRRRAADRDLTAEIETYAGEMNARRPRSVYPESVRAQVRDARPGAAVESWARDLRYALRMLRKSPWLALACVLTFAVGVGANTVVFSMVNGLVFRTLPAAHPAELYMLSFRKHGQPQSPPLTRQDLAQLSVVTHDAVSAVTSTAFDQVGIGVNGQSRLAFAGYVGGNFFQFMGVHPALGRFFSSSSAPQLVLSYDYWRSRFNANPRIIGAPAVVEGHPVTIVGVAPRGFLGVSNLLDMEAYIPSALVPQMTDSGFPLAGTPVLRLRPQATPAQATAQLAVFARYLAHAHPKTAQGLTVSMFSIRTGMINSTGATGPLAQVSVLFLALSGLVLLLAAANLMGVLLARSHARQREMAVRAALGATRMRLARQAFLETLVLAALGAIAGMLLGLGASAALSRLPPGLGIPVVLNFGFDWRIGLYGCAMALLMALVAGLVPAWRAAAADPNQSLRGHEFGASGGRQRLRSALVVAQVAGSLMLLIVGGLFVRSLAAAQQQPLGFQPDHVWNIVLDTNGAGYTPAQSRQFFDTLLPQVRALPGASAASLAQLYPFGITSLDDQFSPPGAPTSSARDAITNAVSPDYFSTLGMRLLRGRGFASTDSAAAPQVVVISRRLAQAVWPGQNPLGRQLVRASAPHHALTVVGVVADAIYNASDPRQPQVYLPLAQNFTSRQVLQIRIAPGMSTPIPEVERLLRQTAPDVPLGQVQSMRNALDSLNGLYLFRLGARLATALGLLGLFLAVIGVYGVVAYAAAQRTREIGIRMALGARPRQVLTAILRQASLIIGVGVFLGLLAAAAFGKLAGAFLVGVSGLDPLTFIAASVLLLLVAFAASLLPALRASHTDPLAVLRCD